MDDQTMIIFLVVLIGTVLPLSLWLAWRIISAQRRRGEAPPSRLADGALNVPVRGLTLARNIPLLGGYSSNNARPDFAIGAEGIRFKVLQPTSWRFEDIARVGAARSLFGNRLTFHARTSRHVLYVDLADEARARDLLQALPRDLPLSDKARLLRDGA